MPLTDLGLSFPLSPHIASRLLVRALGGAQSGNFSHKGRPGKVGGSGPNALIETMRAKYTVTNYGGEPSPQFLLPDGTLLTSAFETHEESVKELLGFAGGYQSVLRAGVARLVVKHGILHGLAIGSLMTSHQAERILDGARRETFHVDVLLPNSFFKYDTKTFIGGRSTADAVRFWVNGHFETNRTLIGTKKSGNRGHAGRIGKVGGSTVNHSSRVARAVASYRPVTARARVLAAASERAIAEATGGKDLPDNEPMDVVVSTAHGTVGIEVKTVTSGVNSKITMHPDSRRRKEQWVKSHHAQGHTVVVDMRGGEPVYYHRDGFGAFRLHTMQPITLLELTHLIQG